jgi:hypothetical protein
MKRMIIALISLVVLAAGAMVFAQDDLPEADAGMQEMDWFIGEWNVESRMLMDAEADEWLEESLTTEHTYDLGGHVIIERFYGPLGGEPFEALSIRKYNPATGKWMQRWMDTSTGPILSWEGQMEGDEFIGYSTFFLDDEGNIAGDNAVREIFYNITEDSFDWRYEQTQDGGETWTVAWELVYTRAE